MHKYLTSLPDPSLQKKSAPPKKLDIFIPTFLLKYKKAHTLGKEIAILLWSFSLTDVKTFPRNDSRLPFAEKKRNSSGWF